MSDADRLLAAFTAGTLLRPSPDVPNIIDLSRAMAALAGAEDVEPSSGSRAMTDLIGPSEHLVFILVDGLGIDFVESLPGSSFLATHLATELRTVFPSATAVALTSFATGEWPCTHAVTGWWTHLPEIRSAASIMQFIKRSDRRSLADLGVTAGQAFPIPSLAARIDRDVLILLPALIADSVYSAYVGGNKKRRAYRSFREAVDMVVDRIRGADSPTYTHLYTHRIDNAAHERGADNREVRAVLLDLDRELERLREGLGNRGRIVLSADHGFLDVPERLRHQIKASDALLGSLRCAPSGDARVLYLHVRDGEGARVREIFRERFGTRFLLVTTEEAEQLSLFGPCPLSATTRSRLGDLIAISVGPDVIEYRSAGGAGRIMSQLSQHSGLTPSEMRVPLVVA